MSQDKPGASSVRFPPRPFADSGATCDNADDYDEACPYTGSTSPDVVYALSVTDDILLTVDFCGPSYDKKVFVYAEDLTLLACNDDFYGDADCGLYVSKIDGAHIVGGQDVCIVVDGRGGDCGAYSIDVDSAPYIPCPLSCPSNFFSEGEPLHDGYVDMYNGGVTATSTWR